MPLFFSEKKNKNTPRFYGSQKERLVGRALQTIFSRFLSQLLQYQISMEHMNRGNLTLTSVQQRCQKYRVQLGAEKKNNIVRGYHQIATEIVKALDTRLLMRLIEQFNGFYFRHEEEQDWESTSTGNGKRTLDRMPSKGALLSLLKWNKTVTFWGPWRSVLCINKPQMQRAERRDVYIQVCELRLFLQCKVPETIEIPLLWSHFLSLYSEPCMAFKNCFSDRRDPSRLDWKLSQIISRGKENGQCSGSRQFYESLLFLRGLATASKC